LEGNLRDEDVSSKDKEFPKDVIVSFDRGFGGRENTRQSSDEGCGGCEEIEDD